ncbi:DUF6515 family protein [Ascidiimonas sp. W6]|uniref:DUF6515 family protein n=1 Tax=Ascidiimonas meishanensis TaxID=3128903 RepID=UPI0030EDBA6B
MKTIKSLLIVILIVGITSCATSQRTTVIVPKKRAIVTKVVKPRVVIHRNTNYYLSKGIWYTKNRQGYVVVNPPAGIVIKSLPRGFRIKKIRGVKYYHYNGVYYKRTGRKYTVVNV